MRGDFTMYRIWVVSNGLRYFGCPCTSYEEARELAAQHQDEHAEVYEAVMDIPLHLYFNDIDEDFDLLPDAPI